jgi:hypothetical protein
MVQIHLVWSLLPQNLAGAAPCRTGVCLAVKHPHLLVQIAEDLQSYPERGWCPAIGRSRRHQHR